MTVLDHLGLLGADVHRELIGQASSGAPIVYLDALDKGLSGASVWQARWRTPRANVMSRLHVFKIGSAAKLQREYDAIVNYAYAIDADTPKAFLVRSKSGDGATALLRSEFVSDSPVSSLRDHLRGLESADAAVACMNSLFGDRMKVWHYDQSETVTESQPLHEALDWWVDRRDLVGSADRLGRAGAEALVGASGVSSVLSLSDRVEELSNEVVPIRLGVVHGDLHTQNVLLDEAGKTFLIDFGWTAERWRAVDFLMMECSLKFLVAPRSARMTDLLAMDDLISGHEFGEPADVGRIQKWADERLFGRLMSRVVGAVIETRRHAIASGAVGDGETYTKGLALLGAGLSSMPPKINASLVLASTAHQVARLG
ncbi:phosphotransferase [Aeromicrobium fastidiosum]|uniref:Phosphotransferase n=1 Tax=Aeromicrobium fastidiosum TaxID=52699 RepID=A0A641AJF7_9ACTN|nr:phosphotransferase [Aeromicrobium fastidiosum]KAA1375945.1 phosphotransferase [Aeromicrobium fastidiosum]MBP2392199.1 hypothetical protein [Aeromicrobium fastidiosum]